MAFLTGGANTLASGRFEVANSCRFNDGDSAYMHKTPGGAGTSADLFTFSMWIKRGQISSSDRIVLFDAREDAENFDRISFTSDDTLEWKGIRSDSQTHNLTTSQVFRDPSAWMHLHFIWDSADGTANNRMRIYVNGTQVTAFGTRANPTSGLDAIIGAAQKHSVGSTAASGTYYDGYMAEVVYLDGQELTPDGNTGEFDSDSGIWKPIDVSGLTFGTNGFYLDFEASGNLGNDANGGTDLTEVNLAATDQTTDTCTNNFCTMNALDNFYAASTLSEGNLKVLTISGNAAYNPATFGLTKGKWYWEVKLVTCSAGDNSEATIIGISNQSPVNAGYTGSIVVNDGLGIRGDGNAWGSDGSAGGGASTSGWDAIAVGNTAMIAVDFDNGKLYHGINGTWGNSGDPTSGSTGTGAYAFTVGTDAWFPGVNQRETSQTATFELNFGSPPYAISSGNTDGDGYGNFEYAVPSGYYSLNTKNLAEYG